MTADSEEAQPTFPAPTTTPMLEGIGRVVALDGPRAWLDLEPTAACASCSGQRCCGAAWFAEHRPPKRVAVAVPADGAALGDRFVVGLPSDSVLSAAALAYGLPLAAALGGAIGATALGAGDGGAAAATVAGLALGLLWARRRSGPLAASGRLTPIVLRRAGCAPPPADEA